jgi:hypothetical protein
MDLFEAFKKMLNGDFTAGEPTVSAPYYKDQPPVDPSLYGGFGPPSAPRREEFVGIPPLGMSGEEYFGGQPGFEMGDGGSFDVMNLLRAAQELENENPIYNPFEAAYNLASAGNNEGGMSLLRNTGQEASLGNEDWLVNPRVRAMIEALGGRLNNPYQGGMNDLMAGAQQAMKSRSEVS